MLVSMLAIAACGKTEGEVTPEPVIPEPIKNEGYIQIDENEKVNLDMAKVFNNGMYWRCVIYDSEMYTIENLRSLQGIKANDGAKGLVMFDWIIGEGFDPAAEGQYPKEEHIYWEPAFYADIIKGDKIWSFVIGDDSMPGIYNMQFTKEKLEISFDGKYNLIDYTTFNNDKYGDVKFEYTGSYEMVKLGHNGYYTADNTYHEPRGNVSWRCFPANDTGQNKLC